MTAQIAIVSSYSDSCGNAAFTRVLESCIRRYCGLSVEVIDLDLSVLQSIDPRVRRMGHKHVAELCSRLASYEAVNIQLEAALYGTFPSDIYSRLARLLAANRRTSVTLHSPRLVAQTHLQRAALKNVLRLQLKAAARDWLSSFRSNAHVRLNGKLARRIAKLNLPAIVHTRRAQKQLKLYANYSNVHVHPLRIVPDDFKQDDNWPKQIRELCGLDGNVTTIGLFGYISRYKGHGDALDAMKHLPLNFHLMIFGRQHPQTIQYGETKDVYLASLAKKVEDDPQLLARVHFMGELDDSSFLQAAHAVDIAWLPYYEVGQDGSGIASIVMDLCPRVIASASFAFDELYRLIPYKNVTRFDIGNSIELAEKTRIATRLETPTPPFGDEFEFSMKTQAELYAKLLGFA